MVYTIVHWSDGAWRTIHWSHEFEDATRMYDVFTKKYGEVRLMVDVRCIQSYDNMIKLKEIQEHLKRAKNKTA